jgi:hypothetical protein
MGSTSAEFSVALAPPPVPERAGPDETLDVATDCLRGVAG